MPQIDDAQVFPIELKDDDSIFQDRYMRNTPALIEPGRRNLETGHTESFTLLFQHLYSFTFSMSLSQEILRKKDEEKRKKAAELAAVGTDSKGPAVQAEVEENVAKTGDVFGASLENMVFKCKFIVPDASEIIFDRRDPNSIKTLVQVSNQNERMKQKARDSLRDKNDFTLMLYNITDDYIRGNATEKLPTDQKAKVPVSKLALQSYV